MWGFVCVGDCVCVGRNGEAGEEASESGPKGLLHLTSKQVRKQDAESDLFSPVYIDTLVGNT